jgi:cell wall hydrolase
MRKTLPFVLLAFAVLPAYAQEVTALERVQTLDPLAMDEVLWLARCIYSESDRSQEQRLVGWVVRNRVESGFRGESYRDVVLEPRQFSAFNSPSERRTTILAYDQDSRVPSWIQAVDVALDVYQARPHERPFSIDTRHFYSPVSMAGGSEPTWSDAGIRLSSVALGVDPDRFQFFSGIDLAADETLTFDPQSDPSRASTPERIDDLRIEQESRAADRASALRRSARVRRFSGKVRRPTRPGSRSRG